MGGKNFVAKKTVQKRIVEEAVDQFFSFKVPIRTTELNSLFRGIDNALQEFAKHVDGMASKEDLIPPVPILTGYKKEAGIKAFVKKELFDTRAPDETTRSSEISVLATSTLRVQLNTLYYAITQLNKLEDSIWEQWTSKRSQEKLIKKSMDKKSNSFAQKDIFDGTHELKLSSMT
ncbi:hypothetical protein K1719_013735 [Acacia pycnantha]|nr:hypothetical protein K1719_013735 [Acacia pycnantha]